MVSEDLVKFADFCGLHTGDTIDKMEHWDLTINQGELLDVPIIDISPFAYECEFIDTFRTGDGIIYISEIKNIQIDSSIKETDHGKIDLMDLKPIIYAPSKYYALKMALGNVGLSNETLPDNSV